MYPTRGNVACLDLNHLIINIGECPVLILNKRSRDQFEGGLVHSKLKKEGRANAVINTYGFKFIITNQPIKKRDIGRHFSICMRQGSARYHSNFLSRVKIIYRVFPNMPMSYV